MQQAAGTAPVRVVHYLNQFFAGFGGEEAAGQDVTARDGAIGPGLALQKALGERGTVVATVICGDNFYAEQPELATRRALAQIAAARPELVVCGPAFNAGRYGVACGGIGSAAGAQLGVPVVSGMYPENPAVEEARRNLWIIETGPSAASMAQSVAKMAELGLRLVDGRPIRSPAEEGYIARGYRRNTFAPQTGARRAVSMLLQKLSGEPFSTEIPLPTFENVAPAEPVLDLSAATVAIVTEGGVVPRGNPDRIESSRATRWAKYSIAGVQSMTADAFECIHAGFDASDINQDPNRLVPLDVLRDLEARGVIGKLHDYYYVTVGSSMPVSRASGFGQEMAAELKAAGVHAVIVPAT